MSIDYFMQYIRALGVLSMTFITLFIVIPNAPKSLLYLTTWGFLLTNCYFFISFFWGSDGRLKKILTKSYAVLWGLNWNITLVYWILIFSYDPNPLYKRIIFHTIPIFFTMIEFPFNQARLKRKHYRFMIVLHVCYFGFYSVTTWMNGEGVYTGIDFTNFLIVFMTLLNFLVSLGAMEIGRRIKNRIIRKNSNKVSTDMEIPERKINRDNLI
ncbi:hypothetical protein SteCoe_7797 [Stentor coeruleus]|uniref:Uncharacterized protein n=1 Tax=Stentor coeruleus TaxID=5963 RepID=A0A1R2CLU0_9CILI|nr:hypothetical protein SteCoe_7797 [Stentor coeruleus]